MAARDQAELAQLGAFLAENEMSELTNEKEGIKWSPKVEVPVASLPSVTPAPVSVINPPLTSTPAEENPAAANSMHATGGICFRDPPVVPKMQLKPTIHESNVPMSVKGDCQNESKSQPLTFVTSISTPSTVTPNVSSAIVNESVAAIMPSMERISASHDLPRVQVEKFDGSPQKYPSFRQRLEQRG